MPFHKIIPPFTLTVIKPLYTKQIFLEINSWGPPPLHKGLCINYQEGGVLK